MSEGGQIHELDPTTVERIAAGEVVERPASVVKELVENALDAGADRIDVTAEAGGTERIVVSDDGHGMSERALRRAVREHTTSKITSIDDLEAGVSTLGFRGEALHAIGAVTRLTICSRAAGADRGTELEVAGGEIERVDPAGRRTGTTVTVEDLFYNVPARRKYLATESTELAHVTRIVRGYALTDPDVAISLTHDDREVFATAGDGDRRSAVMAVYGREVAESMITVEATDLPDGPLEAVDGVISHPETTRSSREYTTTAVDGRYVRASTVRDAVIDAYGGHLGGDRYPFAVIDVSVPLGAVDVNVHPRKLEVRFPDETAAGEQLRTAVRAALSEAGVIRTGAPRGGSAPTDVAIEPGDGADGSSASDDGASDAPTERRAAFRDTAETPARRDSGVEHARRDRAAESERRDSGVEHARRDGADSGDGSPDANAGSAATAADTSTESFGAPTHETTDTPAERQATSAQTEVPTAERTSEQTDSGQSTGGRAHLPTTQLDLGGSDATSLAFDALPAMNLLGQLDETYLVATAGADLLLIDQHAADERIAYERLRDRLDGEVATQALADPVDVTVTTGEAAVFETLVDALARLGFTAELIDDRTLELRTVPTVFAEGIDPDRLVDALSEALAGADPASTVEAAVDDLLADLACAPAVTAHTSLSTGSIRALLAALDDCEHPYSCPHGRPTIVTVDQSEIATRFERDYPGHD
ncbi:DNA mismatch repair endonuclease MutL [Halococcoides cellulosivorans]|uniref:DNA mismatch repair protein MutL n=1 Tax=Halococcoides cellulosivorans TaxID=1679096 RepID=A0A2R4X3D5_9EURY|nr:DNA mismatch repair endonuclease MutL [Halococcoides cellulosivorans]AWB28304.1 DNA mismatch repair endonuclease MutL [Halococcoides cellulosivorans]